MGESLPALGPTLATITVLFVATLVHASLGFGTALVAMPVLALLLGLTTATPLVALAMLTAISGLLWDHWRDIDLGATWQLVLSSALGIPLGLLLLRAGPETPIKATLAVVLIGFSLYNLARPELPRLRARAWVVPFGLAAGILGGAYNTNAPPVVLYGALSHWPQDRLRANLQGYMLPAAVLICAGHVAAGLWTRQVFALYLLSLPAVALAVLLGTRLARRIPSDRFGRILYISLIALAVPLLL